MVLTVVLQFCSGRSISSIFSQSVLVSVEVRGDHLLTIFLSGFLNQSRMAIGFIVVCLADCRKECSRIRLIFGIGLACVVSLKVSGVVDSGKRFYFRI